MPEALTSIDLKGTLSLRAQGKVRDIYIIGSDQLLFVTTDRISAYDVVLKNGIPSKGKILTAVSSFWFSQLSSICKNHLETCDLRSPTAGLPEAVSPYIDSQLEGRSMVVKRYHIFPVEAIVRGYITGSAWSEYKNSGTVHGIKVKEGLQESEAFEKPMYTPSTKAEQGDHDENVHPDQVVKMIGEKYASKIEELALKLYTEARDYAMKRGIIIADTKFEFGLDEKTDEVVLVDEVLTPDSSRFWPAASYEVGKSQDSYDKQFLRDWLTKNNLKGKEDVEIPDDIVAKTREKYIEAYQLLTEKTWQE